VLWPAKNCEKVFAAALHHKAEDEGGLTPGKDDNDVGLRWQ